MFPHCTNIWFSEGDILKYRRLRQYQEIYDKDIELIEQFVEHNLMNDMQFRIIYEWNLKQNSYIFIQEHAFQNVVCEMATILSRPQCVNVREVPFLSLLLIQRFVNLNFNEKWTYN